MNETIVKPGLLGRIANNISAAFGYQQTFEQLLQKGDVERAIAMMTNHGAAAQRNLAFYNTETHKVMSKPRKAIHDKNGKFLRHKNGNRISIPYQKYINEVALVFLYGKPVLWENATPNGFENERELLITQLNGLDDSKELKDMRSRLSELFKKRAEATASKTEQGTDGSTDNNAEPGKQQPKESQQEPAANAGGGNEGGEETKQEHSTEFDADITSLQGSISDEEKRIEEERATIMARIEEIDAITKEIDRKFSMFTDVINECHFNSRIREAKRRAGAEGCSALYFHTYRDKKDNARLTIKVLSKEKGDDIYTMFDQYDKMTACAWGYTTKEANGSNRKHYLVETADYIYECSNSSVVGNGWEVVIRENKTGKINFIVFMQEVEWDGAQTMIDRIEYSRSRTADINDNFADPALVASEEIINNLPEEGEEARLFILKNGGTISYLERSGNNEIRNKEIDDLDDQVMNKTFTPDISIDALRGLGNAAGTTLHNIMTLANIKADKRKESHDEYLDRTASLICTIMENVLYISEGGGFVDLVITHKFQEPFGDEKQRDFDNMLRQHGEGLMSDETALELSYLIKDSDKEQERIRKQNEESDSRRRDMLSLDLFQSAD